MPRASERPAVDIVVPFIGSTAALGDLSKRLARLDLRERDRLRVVDNRPVPEAPPGAMDVLNAPDRQSSYFARNRGAEAGSNPWLLFLDADVTPPSDLVERYFAPALDPKTAVLAGGVIDEPVDDEARPSLATRYALLRQPMSQSNTLVEGRWGYAQTANCAVLREAFEEVGGFRSDVRSGGDADLCWRIRSSGWLMESREDAAVTHRTRSSFRKLVRQRMRHGSGAAWLRKEYPGALPQARWPGLVKWTGQSLALAARAGLRGRSDDALMALVDPLVGWAFELGRLIPNEVDG